ncbi:MAG TPA: chemotaxis protein CheX [Rectinemataceae bacterium]|nr:chemotaxis protein CheX [Rectinemataceae bacterium]
MEKRIIEVFTDSTRRTFHEMFALEASFLGSREIATGKDHGWDITGLVGLAGQAQGVVALRLTAAILEALLDGSGIEVSGAEERVQLSAGLIGELTNIVAGSATSALKGLELTIAPPVVIRGPSHEIGWPAIAPVLGLSFGLPTGQFEVDLCLRW